MPILFFYIIKEKNKYINKTYSTYANKSPPRNDHETALQISNVSLKRKLKQSIEQFSFLSI